MQTSIVDSNLEISMSVQTNKPDILDRLGTIKPNHGSYRKAQDAMIEIANLRKQVADLQAKLAFRQAA